MKILGIDPGLSGAIALYSQEEKLTWEMPTFEITKGGKKRRKIDIYTLKDYLRQAAPDHVYIEQVSAQPGNGATHAFTYGFGAGSIETCVALCGYPFTYVLPQVWKKKLSVPKDKSEARQRASQLVPDMAHCWSLKRQDGVAEAMLIALYGYNERAIGKTVSINV